MTTLREDKAISRPLLYFAGGLVLGETMALWMTVKQELFGLAVLLLVFSCALARDFVWGRGRGKRGLPAFFAAVGKTIGHQLVPVIVVLAGCAVGVWRMEYEQSVIWSEEDLVASYTGDMVAVEGIVAEIGETDYGSRLVIRDCWVSESKAAEEIETDAENGSQLSKDERMNDSGWQSEIPERIRKLYVYLDSDSGLKLGMKIRVWGELESAESARNPGGFDFRLYCRSKGIGGSLSGESVEIADPEYLVIREGLRQIGLRLEWQLERIAAREDIGILKAVLLGEKRDMDDDVYKLYQKNGISHVLAISGLHVSVIGMGLWNGLRKAGVGYWSAGAVAFGMLFCFGSIAGFGPSVIRAVFMMGLSFLAGAFGRTYDLPSAMCVPAMGLILWNPYVLTQASFQLSFLAVFAIFFPGAYLAKVWRLTGIWQNVWTSVSIQLVTLPVVLYHSFEFPVYGVVLNLFVVPLMTYVLVSGILGLAGSFLWLPLGMFFLGGAHYILAFYRWVCESVEQVTGAYLVLGRPSFPAIAAYYGVLFWGTWLASQKRAGVLLWLLGALLMAPVAPVGLSVTFLDVGQGDGIFLQSGDKTLLVDCGSSQEKELGEDCLIPFLKSKGIADVDTVAVTHGDQDHISGIRYLLETPECGIKIGQLIMPVTGIGDEACEELAELADLREIPIRYAECGQQSVWKGILGEQVTVQCLYPEKSVSHSDRNDGSLVLQVEIGTFRMLLTGDVEGGGERAMLAQGELVPVTLLKAAHHGSASSSGEEFLDAVEPAYVVFSYGAENRYGHPADDVVERCKEIGADIWRTADCGAVQVWTDGKIMQIGGWLDRGDGIW